MIYLGKGGKIPYLSKSKILSEVEVILKKCWDGIFPVDVEEICDKLGLRIIPISNLYKTFSIDAYISSDFKTICADSDGFKKNSFRYRFSVAHELGHLVLHRKYFPSHMDGVDEWLMVSKGISSEFSEFQANYFAGNLLVPKTELTRMLNAAFDGSFARNYWNASVGEKEKILTKLKKHFDVSGEVIVRRIRDSYPGIGGKY